MEGREGGKMKEGWEGRRKGRITMEGRREEREVGKVGR